MKEKQSTTLFAAIVAKKSACRKNVSAFMACPTLPPNTEAQARPAHLQGKTRRRNRASPEVNRSAQLLSFLRPPSAVEALQKHSELELINKADFYFAMQQMGEQVDRIDVAWVRQRDS